MYFRKNFKDIRWKLRKKLRKCEKSKKENRKQKTVKNTTLWYSVLVVC